MQLVVSNLSIKYHRNFFFSITKQLFRSKQHRVFLLTLPSLNSAVSDLRQHHPAWELAKEFSISETSLKNYFRGVYGQNISVYLREIRMNKAGELLATTRLSVAEIAEQVGYLNQSKFASVFKKQFGVSPLEYRRSRHLEKK